MRKFTKGILTGLCAVVGFSAGAVAFTQVAQSEDVSTAYAATSYTTKDVAMMAYIDNVYAPNGNFHLIVTLSDLDTETKAEGVAYNTKVDDMPTMFKNFDFFKKVKINGYTLEELGCTSVWENAFDVNSGSGAPLYKLRFHMHADPTMWNNAINDGKVVFGVGSNVTITEGTLIPGYNYMIGDHTATVYRAGCDFVTASAGVDYGVLSYGQTEVESVKYVQGHDGTCGYFGVSLYGDDYAVNDVQTIINQDNYQSSVFTTNKYTNKILVNGESGQAGSYGLFNLGEKGKGYYSFAMYAKAEEMETITIPAGTLFPSYAMTILRPMNAGSSYIMYETQTDVTFYKQADGSWATTEAEEPTTPPSTPMVEKETTVESAFVEGTTDSFTFIKLATHDYPAEIDNWGGSSVKDWVVNSNFASHVLIDDAELVMTGEVLLNVWGNKGVIAFRTSKGSTATKITVKAGCQIPTYNALVNGAKECYVTKEDVTFIKNANGEWVSEAAYVPEEVKKAAIEEIKAYNATKEDALYFAEQVTERAEIVSKASEKISSVGKADQIPAIVAEAKASIDAVQTKAQLIEKAKAEIEGYKADVQYREEQANEKAKIIDEALTAIKNAENASAVAATVANAKTAIDALMTAAEYYETTDVAMIGRVAGWHGNGNFEIRISLGASDFAGKDGEYTYDGELATLLKKLNFFNSIKLGGKTLAEWGCTACYANTYWINNGGPKNCIMIPLSMGKDNMDKASAEGIKADYPITIMEGALIPSYGYLTKTGNDVYRAGCEYVTSASSKAFDIEATAKTEIESVKYVQGFDGTCGYFGISFVGDDYLGDGTQLDVNQNYYFDDKFSEMILVNGETGKVGYYGLFNLGEAGVGYYAFQIFVDANDIVSITIPAGTKFPTRAMTDLFTVNNNPVYIMYEVATEITLYKTADGFGTYAEAVTPELEAYKAGLFREAEEAQRATIVAEAVTAIAALNDKAAIDAIVTEAKTKIDALKTAAQYADEELAGDKAAANATVDAYKADVAYLDEQAQVKAEIIAAAKAAIVAAASVEEINEAVAAAKIAIDELVVRESIVNPAKAEVEGYKADVVYFEEQQTARANIVANTLTTIESATSEAAINEAVAAAKAAIDELKTKEQVEAEAFAAAKAAANTAVDNIKKGIDFDLYEDAQVIAINGLYANVKAAIAAATTEDEMNALVEKFAEDIENVPTKGSGDVVDSSSTTDSSSNGDNSGNGGSSIGCGGTVGSLACGVMLLGVAVASILKKKED